MIPQMYQAIKPEILEIFSVSKDAIHMHVGFGAFLFAYLSRWKKIWLVMTPITLSLVMEMLDAYTDYGHARGFMWASHLHDLLNTNFIPVIVYFIIARDPSDRRYT